MKNQRFVYDYGEVSVVDKGRRRRALKGTEMTDNLRAVVAAVFIAAVALLGVWSGGSHMPTVAY